MNSTRLCVKYLSCKLQILPFDFVTSPSPPSPPFPSSPPMSWEEYRNNSIIESFLILFGMGTGVIILFCLMCISYIKRYMKVHPTNV